MPSFEMKLRSKAINRLFTACTRWIALTRCRLGGLKELPVSCYPPKMRRVSPMRVLPLHVFVLVFRFALVLSKYLLEFAASLVNLATNLVADNMLLFHLLEDLTEFMLRLGLCRVQL